MPPPPHPVLPPTWTQVLEAMQRSLAEALAAVGEPAAPAAAPERRPPWQDALARLDGRLGQLDASSRQAEQGATAVEAELAGGAEAVRRWLAAAAANRQALADGSGPKVCWGRGRDRSQGAGVRGQGSGVRSQERGPCHALRTDPCPLTPDS
jgi:hypothetical protein